MTGGRKLDCVFRGYPSPSKIIRELISVQKTTLAWGQKKIPQSFDMSK